MICYEEKHREFVKQVSLYYIFNLSVIALAESKKKEIKLLRASTFLNSAFPIGYSASSASEFTRTLYCHLPKNSNDT